MPAKGERKSGGASDTTVRDATAYTSKGRYCRCNSTMTS